MVFSDSDLVKNTMVGRSPIQVNRRHFWLRIIYLFNGDLVGIYVGIYGLLMVILVVIYIMGFNGDLWCFTIWQTNIASQFCLEHHRTQWSMASIAMLVYQRVSTLWK